MGTGLQNKCEERQPRQGKVYSVNKQSGQGLGREIRQNGEQGAVAAVHSTSMSSSLCPSHHSGDPTSPWQGGDGLYPGGLQQRGDTEEGLAAPTPTTASSWSSAAPWAASLKSSSNSHFAGSVQNKNKAVSENSMTKGFDFSRGCFGGFLSL